MSNEEKNQNKQKTNINNHYLVLREKNTPNDFHAELIDEKDLDNLKAYNFNDLSNWALENNKGVFIVKVNKSLIKIIPEVKIVNKYRK